MSVEPLPKNKRVVVAMSGGVDSSVAAALLKEAGWEVIGLTFRLWEEGQASATHLASASCLSREAAGAAAQAALSLGIEHHVLELQEEFRGRVIDYFVREYRAGRTPNPCLVCNSGIKFAALLEQARRLGASHLATGHYARTGYSTAAGRFLLKKGVDTQKDQSYMLYRLSQGQLRRCLFPLGELTKREVRRKAAELGLGAAREAESQEICFVPDNDYRGFLRSYGLATRPGPIISSRGERLGTHKGIAFYTIGQRKGLGLSCPRPLYVLEIRPRENTLIVGERAELYRAGLEAEEVHLVSVSALDGAQELTVKIRYRSPEIPARVIPLAEPRTVRVIFKQPQPAVTPGQAAVFYRGDLVIGGGTIRTSLKEAGE